MVGQNIGKYRVLDRIGRGGMGTVYRGVDETLHREVAIKVLNAELNDPTVARRFRAEAVTVARLSHPGIATIYELLQHEGQWLMVMEFVRGETLEARVRRKGQLTATESADVCIQALAAIAHAHGLGVVHRDLKPANMMVTEAGTVKIMDFGIARVVGTEHLTSAGFMMGTPAYMAPEQVRGEDIDARADLYAMGVVLYHLVTGALPFKGETPFAMAQSRLLERPTPVRSVRAELPPWLGDVLDIALARDPSRRFQNAAAFRDALRCGLSGLPIPAVVPASVPPELVATAAVASIPGPAPVAERPGHQRADAPPAPVAVRAQASTDTYSTAAAVRPAPSHGRLPLFAGLALVLVLAGWMAMRSTSVFSPASASPSEAPQPAPAADLAATTSMPASKAVSGDPVVSASPPAAVAPPGSSPGETSATGGQPTDLVGGAVAPVSRGATSPLIGAAGRGAASDAPLAFKDTRLLVVTGKKAEEQESVLSFGAGQISVSGEDGARLAVLPYRDVSYAYYTRAKDPKWSVVLAAPPADVDLPGGFFRPTRRWLTLQSRAEFVILRLSEATWNQVLDAVTARTGVQVTQPTSGRQ